MTDHKTIREALRLAEKKCFDATGRIDLELSSSITQALAALDRIEAKTFVPKFTEEQWLNLFRTVAARTWTPEQAVEHMKDDVSGCVTPSVPQEMVDEVEYIKEKGMVMFAGTLTKQQKEEFQRIWETLTYKKEK